MCWETFTYPRLSKGLVSVRGRKVILSPTVKGHVIGCCVTYHTCIIVLRFAPTLRCFWLNLYSLDLLEVFGGHFFRWGYEGVCKYVVKLPHIFYLQGQVVICLNFLCRRFGRVMGQGNCYIIIIIIIVVVVATDRPMVLTNNSVYCHYSSNN